MTELPLRLGYIPAGLVALLVGCGAPPPIAIAGKVEDAIRRGIASGRERFDHRAWDEVLQAHRREGGRRFDYRGLKQGDARFTAYLRALAGAPLDSLGRDELLALFLNAYNAYTVKTILDAVSPAGDPRVSSIREIPRVFDRPGHLVGGFRLSLNQMEHNILRPIFRDPRIHFAVNCASVSCPPLPPRAFQGESVGDQLDEAARATLSSAQYLRVEGGRLRVTRILDWYGEDFTDRRNQGSEKTLPAYLRKYGSDEVRRFIDSRRGTPEVTFMGYDWSLNLARER